MEHDASSPKEQSFSDDIQNVLAEYRRAKVDSDVSNIYESEFSESDGLDRYDSTFVVDDDEIIDESQGDFDEESLLSDPSDLFDNQTESEPESEPEIIYRERKLPHNSLIDDEAEEDDDEYDEEDEYGHLFQDDEADENLSDSEGQCQEITQPLNASDYVEDEADECNDLSEMYDGLVGREILLSEEDLPLPANSTVLISDDDSPVERSSTSIEKDTSSSSPRNSCTDSPIKLKKRRRLRVFDTDCEMSVEKNVKKQKGVTECVNLVSPAENNHCLVPLNSMILCPDDSPIVIIKRKKSRFAKKIILDSDEEDENHENATTNMPTAQPKNVYENARAFEEDSFSNPHVEQW